ncbi:MAG: heavy-metal-associated domain-containing protein [Phycisphaerales bacterium]|nr:heavy-metal-associated domain-containing protein [Phycisphaerales bacterium]
MHCPGCAAGVRAALASLPGVTDAKVDLAAGRASIEHGPSVGSADLVRAVEERGFTAHPAAG